LRRSLPCIGHRGGARLASRILRVPPADRAARADRRATARGLGRGGDSADREPARATCPTRLARTLDHPHRLYEPRKFSPLTRPNSIERPSNEPSTRGVALAD